MNNFAMATALCLCSLSTRWLALSASESRTLEVQPGEAVTLSCTNKSRYNSFIFWFRLVNRSSISCITTIYKARGDVSYCDGFKNGRFNAGSNTSTVFLKINQVNVSDSGLYFCGFYIHAYTVFKVLQLNVQSGEDSEDDVHLTARSAGTTELAWLTLGILTGFLVTVIIVLVVKIRKLQRAHNEDRHAQQSSNSGYDDLNYTTIALRPQARRKLEPNVVYAATR